MCYDYGKRGKGFLEGEDVWDIRGWEKQCGGGGGGFCFSYNTV